MVDTIGSQLGLHGAESFIDTFLPQIDTNSHALFSKAIDELSGENAEYWRDIRDAPPGSYETLLSLCTEQVIECFSAEFVSSSYEVVASQDAS